MKPQRKLTTKKKMPRRLLNMPWKSYTRRPRQKRLHIALLTKRTQVCISIGGYMTHASLTLWYPIGPSGIQLPVEFQQVADQDPSVCNIFMFNDILLMRFQFIVQDVPPSSNAIPPHVNLVPQRGTVPRPPVTMPSLGNNSSASVSQVS